MGGGLGKRGQGIVQPIQVDLGPLPPGLGLDFLHEQRAKLAGKGGEGDEDNLERIRRTIVDSFNRRGKRPRGGGQHRKHSKNKSVEDGGGKQPQREEDEGEGMFGFLNKVESKQHKLPSSSVSKGNFLTKSITTNNNSLKSRKNLF
jgi:hypothetical protein